MPGYTTLSAHAQIGLAAAPVALSLAGKTTAQLEQIGQGSYIVNTQASCPDCHSSPTGGYLAGGVTFPIGPGASVVTRNLTPDPTTGLTDSLGQYIQATRNGTDILNGNSSLIAHPWPYERWMGTDDLTAIYSYLKVIPAVKNDPGMDKKPMLQGTTFPGYYNEGAVARQLPPEVDSNEAAVPDPGHVLRGTAIVPLDVAPPDDPTQAALYGRGSYLINAVIGCPNCHTHPDRVGDAANPLLYPVSVNTGAYLMGGAVYIAGPLAPIVGVVRSTTANLAGSQHGFFAQPDLTFTVFLQLITEGVHADEITADSGAPRPLAWPMPYKFFGKMGLDDLEALYTYLRWIATHAGNTGAADVVQQEAARYCAKTADCNTAAGETCFITGDAGTGGECVGKSCSQDSDCDTCQTCSGAPSGTCVAPASGSACVAGGISF
jgi:hypothetical protein